MTKDKVTKQISVFSGLVFHEGKFLMTLRTEEECPEAHMKWEFPGGKVDFGETPKEAVAREILEETGVTVKVRKLIPYVNTSYWEYDWGTLQVLCFVYECDFLSQEPLKEMDHHIVKVEWIEHDKIKDLETLPGTMEILELLKK